MRPKRRNLRTSVEEFQHRSTGSTMHPTGVIDSYDGDGRGRVEGLSSSQPFDIYFYKSDDTAAAGLGNRMLQHDAHPGAPITRYTNLDIVTPEGVTLTGQVVVLLETLGTGTFADVYKAEYNGRIVAVKIPKASLHSAKQREAFNRELHALRKTADSKLTLDLIGYRPQPHYWLITSYMSEGTLNSRIKSAAGRPLPLREVLDVGIELSSAMQDLHAHHLMHRDLTPFNLLFHEGHLRLADFGVAVDLDHLGGPDALVPASPSLPSAAAHTPSSFFSSSSSSPLNPASSTSPFAFAIPSFASPAAAPLPEHCYGGYFTSPAAAGEDAEYGDDMALDDEHHHHDGDDLYAYDDDEYDYDYDYDDDGACVEMGDTGGDDGANDVDVGTTNNDSSSYDLPLDMSPNGHPYYRAPEVNEGRAYSLAAEIYNFGSVLYECMTGTVLSAQAPHVAGVPAPTGGHMMGGLRRSAERERRGGGFPDELWRLQVSCWDRDPAKRPSFAAICQRLTALRASLGPAAPTA